MTDEIDSFATSAELLEMMYGRITYDENAPLVKTHCYECGHETGEERPHATNCACLYCRELRKSREFWAKVRRVGNVGRTMSFPKVEDVK